MTATFRRAGTADAEAVRNLTRDAYAKWVPVIGREPRPMVADHDRAVREHWVDLIDDEAGLVAVIEMIPDNGFLLIESIAVRQDQQRKGVAAALLRHAEAVALQLGFAELRLYTNAAFTSNVNYYPRHGFAETGRTRLSDGGTMVHFAKPVS